MTTASVTAGRVRDRGDVATRKSRRDFWLRRRTARADRRGWSFKLNVTIRPVATPSNTPAHRPTTPPGPRPPRPAQRLPAQRLPERPKAAGVAPGHSLLRPHTGMRTDRWHDIESAGQAPKVTTAPCSSGRGGGSWWAFIWDTGYRPAYEHRRRTGYRAVLSDGRVLASRHDDTGAPVTGTGGRVARRA